MKRFGRNMRWCVISTAALCLCWACVATGPVEQRADESALKEGTELQAEQSAPAAPVERKLISLSEIRLLEAPEGARVELSASGPVVDYDFRRLGEDRFALELSGLDPSAPLPPLPFPVKGVRLSYDTSGENFKIIGALSGALDHYVVNTQGNDLGLDLMVSRGGKATAKHAPPASSSKPAVVKKASVSSATAPAAGKAITPPAQGTEAEAVDGGNMLLRKQYTGKPISLDLLDADLRNVLRLLADITNSNMVIEPDVAGRVTLKVEQVPWDQVLDMVLSMNGLAKEQTGNVIRIARQDKLKEEWGKAAEEIRAKQDLMEVAKDVGEMATVYLTVNYAQPSAIAAKINEIRSERGRVSIDERTSLIIYSDYPARIRNARQLLSRLDKPTAQVLIEARIVTMNLDLSRTLGIDWSLSFSHAANSSTSLIQNFQLNAPPGNPFGFTLARLFGQTLVNLDLQLSALETANQVNIMGAPRVMTLDNVKATVTQGSQIPYPKQNEFGVTSTEFKDATIELSVTPHITPDKKVRLQIDAKQDEPSTTVVGSTGDVGIETRKIQTELLVDDGNIIVIGGVIRNRDVESRTATPGLHRVPILGRLFKKESQGTSKTELLIFITPKIIEAPMPADRV